MAFLCHIQVALPSSYILPLMALMVLPFLLFLSSYSGLWPFFCSKSHHKIQHRCMQLWIRTGAKAIINQLPKCTIIQYALLLLSTVDGIQLLPSLARLLHSSFQHISLHTLARHHSDRSETDLKLGNCCSQHSLCSGYDNIVRLHCCICMHVFSVPQ